jgi:hypothetical protein
MSTPTDQEFRALAATHGWPPKDLALFGQADEPEKTAERLLSHLAGVVSTRSGFSSDDCPPPSPILCEVYRRGALAQSLIEMPVEAPTEDTRTCAMCPQPLTGREGARCCSDRCRQ